MRNGLIIALAALVFAAPHCKPPPVPAEAKQAEALESDLWKADASSYAPEEFEKYKTSLKEAKDKLFKEKAKFIWFRKYEPVRTEFKKVLADGERILDKVQKQKETRAKNLRAKLSSLHDKINTIKKQTMTMNEGRFARTSLTRAELKRNEAELLFRQKNFDGAERTLEEAALHIRDAEDVLFSILDRYNDPKQIETWRKWVNETISESKKNGTAAIVVSKIERKLTLYRKGKPYLSCSIGLARNGLSNKLHAGDYATPEGKYQVIKKLSSSKYHKALLINYPNDEDRAEFASAEKKGLIPPGVSIGGLIEIHGGGNDSLTDGCISVEDEDIDRIFNLVEIGTPVTIVGTLNRTHEIFSTRKDD